MADGGFLFRLKGSVLKAKAEQMVIPKRRFSAAGLRQGFGHSRNFPEGLRQGVGHSRKFPEGLRQGVGHSRKFPEGLRQGVGHCRKFPEGLRQGVGQSRKFPEVLRQGFGRGRRYPAGLQQNQTPHRHWITWYTTRDYTSCRGCYNQHKTGFNRNPLLT